MLTVVGVQRKTGTFEGNDYDNIMIHCLNDAPSKPTLCGGVCEIVKVKTHNVISVLGGLVKTDSDWRDLLGCKIRVFYDRYGTAEQITLAED